MRGAMDRKRNYKNLAMQREIKNVGGGGGGGGLVKGEWPSVN